MSGEGRCADRFLPSFLSFLPWIEADPRIADRMEGSRLAGPSIAADTERSPDETFYIMAASFPSSIEIMKRAGSKNEN